ncbi:MAG: hypothetical protein GY852_00685 [bacterium]|nr:hypothetical protein [bacterium]
MLLSQYYLSQFKGVSFTDKAIFALRSYEWPGNIRELKTLIRRACINSGDGCVSVGMLELPCNASEGSLIEQASQAARLKEKTLIESALSQTNGNRRKAAEILGVSYRTMLTKIKDLRIEVNR